MKVGKLLVFAAVLGLATGAGAATVSPLGGNFVWDISTPAWVGDGSEGLVAFQLTVVNVSGIAVKNPQAFDGAPDPNNPPGQDGIQADGRGLHEEQSISGFGHTISPDIDYWTGSGAPAPSTVDSYFLQPDPASVFGATEDQIQVNLPYSAEAGDYGAFGFRSGWSADMTGTFSMKGTNPNNYWDLAYLVVPCGTNIRIDAQVAGADGVKEDFDFTFAVTTGACIPVPAALPFGFVGLLLAIRRRFA